MLFSIRIGSKALAAMVFEIAKTGLARTELELRKREKNPD